MPQGCPIKLCLTDGEERKDPRQVAALAARHGVSHLLTLPSFYARILEQWDTAADLRCAIVAGEACPGELPARHFGRMPDAALVNEYGPTEGSVWCAAWTVPPDAPAGSVPIGKPIPSMQVYVLDQDLEPAPIGVTGEIYISGAGIARGYHRQPGLTAERFLPSPFPSNSCGGREPGQRLYRTGDLARLRADGTIEYVGRVDHQVKIRGFRIELGEIEARLQGHKTVREAVVAARADTPGEARLVAYVVPADARLIRAERQVQAAYREELRGYLQAGVPEYMVPGLYVLLERLPLTPNGKPDRGALPAPDAAQAQREYVAPRTAIEIGLAAIWQDALKLELRDNFFSLGGHSLLAAQVVARVQQDLGVTVPLRQMLESTSLEQFAQQVEASAATRLTDAKAAELDALLAGLEAE